LPSSQTITGEQLVQGRYDVDSNPRSFIARHRTHPYTQARPVLVLCDA